MTQFAVTDGEYGRSGKSDAAVAPVDTGADGAWV